MTDFVVQFILNVIGRTISSVSSTYLVRFLDKFTHKNNRQS